MKFLLRKKAIVIFGLTILASLSFASNTAHASFSKVVSISANSCGPTSAVDTTGADLLVISTGSYLSAATVSDSKGNTWNSLTSYAGGLAVVRTFYAVNPTVGSGHTFSCSGSYPAIGMIAFSGATTTTPFDLENGSGGSSGTTNQSGAITPSENNSLVVGASSIWNGGDGNHISSIDGGFTLEVDVAKGGANFGIAMSYIIQTSAASANPTWTDSLSNDSWADSIASFKSAGGGGGGGGVTARRTAMVIQ